ncbi:MAG: class I SAM-dependent methyltransferase [Candidatus Micrarchaeota archaeon]
MNGSKPVFIDPRSISPKYTKHPGPYAIDKPELRRIFPRIELIEPKLEIGEHIKGDADPPSIRMLCTLVKYLGAERIVELGTFRGKTTHNIALNLPEEGRVITVDLPIELRPDFPGATFYSTDETYFQHEANIGAVFRAAPTRDRIQQIFFDCTKSENQVREALQGKSVDIFLVDAAHDYDTVRDTMQWIPNLLSPGGVIFFDDYNRAATHIGVMHYLMEDAYKNGTVYYAYLPQGEQANMAFFLNLPECRGRNWRE